MNASLSVRLSDVYCFKNQQNNIVQIKALKKYSSDVSKYFLSV